MFGYRSTLPKVRLITERMVVRLVYERDTYRLAEYYSENYEFLKPWEPTRDSSHCQPSGWINRLNLIIEMQRQGVAFHFLLLDSNESEVIGVANFSNILRGAFHACYLGYSLGEKWQGKGLMYEALQPAIRYMQRQQGMHRIMANYMPDNHRSGKLLERLGFEREGYAKKYLMINGVWQDHVLTALTDEKWSGKS
ncbi:MULTISPECIES: ribosomal protein S5-alanine N-acetyltransferase [Photorhabdus]|uniref:ribosomal protein S5-alanine N-acetyltransferase n=1 Tax=Photorhabdus TaxID=29487 RepID=UPI000DCF56C8|nr:MULTISPECIES: ribosomal protein S5-alanine N-acetyltransferase [Photorhabdus]MCT8341858.1 ribosomal protein S5-alanine N-acetyltransferase [Photorhabdus kleinii]RAX03734.1 30S ribosomal protein S5 alanine N-acetyltransferase [Photorhabdus sp. S9-53]RAX04047.1 30S ribosomal protein S5 alanine N-acetyltransferase [Photorhabdus sp. S10-54]RAX06083.1 30S ribosomal protein S5 alanine N-acetyltransferase [Photorhabdus sp. S8-52]